MGLGFGVTYAGGPAFLALACLAWAALLAETSVAASRAFGLNPLRFLILDFIVFGPMPFLLHTGRIFSLVAVGLLWPLAIFLFFPATREGLTRWFFSAAVHSYVALGVHSFVLLREESMGAAFLVLTVVVLADTGAYLTGRAIGRRPLAPSISPSKTVEGAAGGMIVSAAAAMVMLQQKGFSILPSAAMAAILSALAVLGDLFESFLKRGLGVKDFGSLLPGHGGFFDRLDSLLAVSIGLMLFLTFG